MITILLAEHRQLERIAIGLLLEQTPDIRVVAEASDGLEVLSKFAAVRPHVSVLEASIPGMGNVELVTAILSIDAGARILVLTPDFDPVTVAMTLRAGAIGCITKRAAPSDLYAAIQSVAHGKCYFAQPYGSTVPERFDVSKILSGREEEILSLVTLGQTHREIARELRIGSKTVCTYMSRAAHKLGLDSNRELRFLASRSQGFVTRGCNCSSAEVADRATHVV